MSRGPQHPLQEGQELIGILETDDRLDKDDENESVDDDGVVLAAGEASVAPWDQIIAAVDREFLPLDAASPWILPRFRAR